MLHRLLTPLVFAALPFAAIAASPLADAPSAFLRAHADSPVHWMLWGDAAFDRAKAENKPVFLAIGAFTNELSRAMRQQSFAREENAALLNENFVCVLVDRDDQPDVAALAQHYLNVVKQAQGWPLNLWLTPEMKPFEGASYLPPSDEWGKEGFSNAIKRVLAGWQSDPAAQRAKADEAVAAQLAAAPAAPPAVDTAAIKQLLADSTAGWMALYDANNGGFGDPPKYPQPELLRFLLRGDEKAREAALATLRKLAASPVRDPLDGGFFRYASDAEGKLPYLQKTLSDQARLALAYLDAAKISGDSYLATIARSALAYTLTLRVADHGFTASEDGTPETIMPSFLWTQAEITAALGEADSPEICRAFGVTASGNLAPDAYLGINATGKNLLSWAGMPVDEGAKVRLFQAVGKLRSVRLQRPAPLRDDVATAGTHGLLLAAMTRALEGHAGGDFADAITQNFALIRKRLAVGNSSSPRDLALLMEGLLAFHAETADATAHVLALELFAKLTSTFGDSATGRFFAAPEKLPPGLWARVHVPTPDNADLPGVEPALLLTLSTHGAGTPEQRAQLAAVIAQEIADSPSIARGDQLLALQAYVQGK